MALNYNDNYPKDAYGNPSTFVPGAVYAFHADVAYNVADATVLFSLPRGAVILDSWLKVWTAFDGDGTDTLEIGITGDTDGIATAAVVSSTGVIRAGSSGYDGTSLCEGVALTEPVDVMVSYDHDGTAAAAGLATVFVSFKVV